MSLGDLCSPHKRTMFDKRALYYSHRDLAFFASKVDPAMAVRLCGVLQLEAFSAKRVRVTTPLPPLTLTQSICEQGDPSDSFYIIIDGICEVHVKGAKNPVATLAAGLSFGEMGIIRGTNR